MSFYLKTESATPKTHTRQFSCGSKNAYRLLQVENPGLRFYSASLSRWINRDPIGEKGGANVYGFVGNLPVSTLDPRGLSANDPPYSVSAPSSCGLTSYKVCCRSVAFDPATDPWWGKWIYPLIRHCDLRSGPCSTGEDSYSVSMTSSGKMDNGQPCRCASCESVSSCLTRNPYSAGTHTWGDNCQSNTKMRLSKCCLQSSWVPNAYAYSL